MGKSNQKTVSINKAPCNKQNYYATINLAALEQACATLSGDALKMWVYFSKNQDGWVMQLSSKHAEDTFNLSKRRYDNAIGELIEQGYLVDENAGTTDVINHWAFLEVPLDTKENKPLEQDDTREDKPLQQNDTSLTSQENKPCKQGDTRNITDTTNTTIDTKDASSGRQFQDMTPRERDAYFRTIYEKRR